MLRLIFLFLFSLLVIACVDNVRSGDDLQGVRVYTSSQLTEIQTLEFYESDDLVIGMPEGWEYVSEKDDEAIRLKFEKRDGSRMLVICYDSTVAEDMLPDMLQGSVNKAVPNALSVNGVWRLDSEIMSDLRFQMYKGSMAVDKTDMPMSVNIAWLYRPDVNVCSYGFIHVADADKSPMAEYEFIAVLQSLRLLSL